LIVALYARLLDRHAGGAFDVWRQYGNLSALLRLLLGWRGARPWIESQGGAFVVVNENLANLVPAVPLVLGAGGCAVDFAGRPLLVYFGFTYCPDVCPLTLQTVAAAYKKLPEGIEHPQTLLITVDPERDTPEALATYLSSKAFPEGTLGLTGTEAEIRAAADAFKADYARIDQPDSLAGYTMDHTSLLYLMDENWQLQTFFTHQDTPDTIAACLQKVAG
jgi:cytochrome oxidase Cu insertion factor (SCO1/SenC/PrrC family)